MKILQVNCVYKTGSTGKIVYDVHSELLNNGYQSIVCYGRGKKMNEEFVYKTCGEKYSKFNNLITRFTGVMYGGCFFSTNKLIGVIKKEKPDIVHLHCINGYFVNVYRLITWLKKNNIKTVLTLHAEFMHTANCGYAYECERYKTGCGKCLRFKKETKSLIFDKTAVSFKKMYKAFEGFNDNLIVTSVSPWLMDRAQGSLILGNKQHRTVMNGLNSAVFHPTANRGIFDKIHIRDKKAILYVTPYFSLDPEHVKGGYYVVELAKRMPELNFVIVGCKEKIDNLPENIINVGRVENQIKLAEYYTSADVTVIPSRRETFSMILAESLCCGTPVVGFKAGGPESIAITEFCDLVNYGDIDALENAIKETLSFEKNIEISDMAINKYDKKMMYSAYLAIYNELVEKNSD